MILSNVKVGQMPLKCNMNKASALDGDTTLDYGTHIVPVAVL